jgi:hypothetical protein
MTVSPGIRPVPSNDDPSRYEPAAIIGSEATSGECSDDPWEDMFPLPEDCTLEEPPSLTQKQSDMLAILFSTGKN